MGKAHPVDKAQRIILFLSISFLLEESGDSIYFYPLKNKKQPQNRIHFHISHHHQEIQSPDNQDK